MAERVMAALPAREMLAGKHDDDRDTPSTNNTIPPRVPYTSEEKVLLQENLARHGFTGGASWKQETLPLLITMVEKVLQIAADSYERYSSRSNNDDSSNNNNCSKRNSTNSPMKNSGLKTGVAATDGMSYQMDQFREENTYILEQLRLQDQRFFTLPRLWEVLADPFKNNCDAEGKLRGEKLQSALRRCVLVSAPMFTDASPDLC